MKKIFFPGFFIILSLIGFISCKKILSKLLPPFETTTGEITMSIPVIPFSNISGFLGSKTMYYNLDSNIKARTGGNFGISDVSYVKVKNFNMTVLNSDQNNNISNLQSIVIDILSNSNSSPLTIATASIPDGTSNNLSIDVAGQPDILSFLRGTQITYNFSGQVRRATTHPLDISVVVTVIVK